MIDVMTTVFGMCPELFVAEFIEKEKRAKKKQQEKTCETNERRKKTFFFCWGVIASCSKCSRQNKLTLVLFLLLSASTIENGIRVRVHVERKNEEKKTEEQEFPVRSIGT